MEFQATWVDTYGNTYEQTVMVEPHRETGEVLGLHLQWVCTHHAIASYAVKAV